MRSALTQGLVALRLTLSLASLACLACSTKETVPATAASIEEAAISPPAVGASEAPPGSVDAALESADAGVDDAAALALAEDEPAFSSCNAPSVKLLRAYDDDRTLAALAKCTADGGYVEGYDAGFSAMIALEQSVVGQCGQAARARKPDLPRMLDSALPLDSRTKAHVRALFREGKAKGRRADVFGLVGDSITIDHSFMRPFSWTSRVRVTLSPAVREALAIDHGERTIVDLFRGVAAADAGASSYFDSYGAIRAARIGIRANWAIAEDSRTRLTPLGEVVDSLSPAYAVVMYGTNDALWYGLPLANISKGFGAALRGVVDALESRGVIPILTTIPKHMHDRRFVDCADLRTVSNARYMVQTNVANAVIADVACERSVPLIDYRYALDPLLNHGIGYDGVHPSYYAIGGGVLDDNGLQCGFNVRNLVTLRMLKVVHDAVTVR